MTKRPLILVAILGCSSFANADVFDGLLAPGWPLRGETYELAIVDIRLVRPGLSSAILEVRNISGDPAADPNVFDGLLGGNGLLHNDQAFGGFGQTPTVQSFGAFGATPTDIDSHFLPESVLDLPGGAAAEVGTLVDSGVGSSLSGGVAGFGLALEAGFGFEPAPTVQVARVVFPAGSHPFFSPSVDFSFRIANGSPSIPGEVFSGRFSSPEPGGFVLLAAGALAFPKRRLFVAT